MRKPLLLISVFQALVVSSHSEFYQLDVRGRAGTPKFDQKGFSVILQDLRSDEQLASIPDTFGTIESAVLVVTNAAGKRLCRAVLGPQRIEGASTDFEFNLRRDLLANSHLLVSHRNGDDLHVAKIILGSFEIREPKK
jgi:hypothetical protein